MVNLVGGLPPTARVLELPGAKLHLYGKDAAPGRKLGHVNLTAATPEETERNLRSLVDCLPDPAMRRALAPERFRPGPASR